MYFSRSWYKMCIGKFVVVSLTSIEIRLISLVKLFLFFAFIRQSCCQQASGGQRLGSVVRRVGGSVLCFSAWINNRGVVWSLGCQSLTNGCVGRVRGTIRGNFRITVGFFHATSSRFQCWESSLLNWTGSKVSLHIFKMSSSVHHS